MKHNFKYPLLNEAFSKQDLDAGIKVIKSKKLTMSTKTKEFELKFAKFVGSKYALMVNSGSSANLLATFASCNPYRKNRFKIGDEALIPALCWSTSLWPLVQAGLKIKFLDIDRNTLNVSSDTFIKNINKKTKVIMAVHVLGGSTNIEKLRNICKKRKIILIEDTCESLGSKFKNKHLGTFGDFGTYSFYYSHQITSGEGGMVVCNNYDDYTILHSLRSHGWTRGLKLSQKFRQKDHRFIFYNMGFNLRPTDITAAIGLSQFKRIKIFQNIRTNNLKKIISSLKKSKLWDNQYQFQDFEKYCDPSWFGLPLMLTKNYEKNKQNIINKLEKNGIETRPIISGNFINQPAIKKFKLIKNNIKNFVNAQFIEDAGFFIGLHTKPISKKTLNFLINNLLTIEKSK
jgi:CDP-4-dehydro-6-deoxyglucose reductase, E1